LYDKVAIEITKSQNESDFDILKEIFQTDTDRGLSEFLIKEQMVV
jgi:hypothetical protein